MKRIEGAEKDGIIYNFYIDDKDKLLDLINKDIMAENYPDSAIFDMFKVNFSDFEVWLQKNDVFGTGYFHKEKTQSYFIFTEQELIKIYKAHLKTQEEIIGLRLHVFVKAIANSKGSIFIDIQSFLKNEDTPEDMQFITLENNFIEIIIKTDCPKQEKSFIEKSLERVERIMNCYSYIAKVGFRIISCSLEGIPRKGISVTFGVTTIMYHAIEYQKIERFLKNYRYFDFILDRYNRSLCEINPKSKLLILWSLIEEIFFKGKNSLIIQDFKSNSLLSNNEKTELKKALKSIKITDDKVTKILQRVYEIKEKDRNTIIAENISKFLNEKFDIIYNKFKIVARIRGKQAHTTEESAKEVLESIDFLQTIVEKCIERIVSEKL